MGNNGPYPPGVPAAPSTGPLTHPHDTGVSTATWVEGGIAATAVAAAATAFLLLKGKKKDGTEERNASQDNRTTAKAHMTAIQPETTSNTKFQDMIAKKDTQQQDSLSTTTYLR